MLVIKLFEDQFSNIFRLHSLLKSFLQTLENLFHKNSKDAFKILKRIASEIKEDQKRIYQFYLE